MILHLNAGNDRNGNPRRLYMLTVELVNNSFSPLDKPRVWVEGYGGMPNELRTLVRDYGMWPVSMEITPREYKRLERDAPIVVRI